MKTTVLICRAIIKNPHITLAMLAAQSGISPAETNLLIKELQQKGLLLIKDRKLLLTDDGMNFMKRYKVDNAIITAAGFGSRFVPLTYETPKGLLKVFGEPMVERQIKQLLSAGITDITIVTGYLKEKFEYLTDKYNVKLVYNPEYNSKNSIASLYCVRHLLKNTYILASDHWLLDNIYNEYEPESWYSGAYMKGKTSEWCLSTDKTDLVTDVLVGGRDSYVMYGPAYFSNEFSKKYRTYVEEYYNTPGTDNYYWEQILKDKISDLKFYCNQRPDNTVYEFENLEELRLFDPKYQTESENAELEFISNYFNIGENEIVNLKCLQTGTSDKAFLFTIKGETYHFQISDTQQGLPRYTISEYKQNS